MGLLQLHGTHEEVAAAAAASASAVAESAVAGSAEALHAHHPQRQPAARKQGFGRVLDIFLANRQQCNSMMSRSSALLVSVICLIQVVQACFYTGA